MKKSIYSFAHTTCNTTYARADLQLFHFILAIVIVTLSFSTALQKKNIIRL